MNYLSDFASSLSLDDIWGRSRHHLLQRADDVLAEALARVGADLLLPWTLLTLLTWSLSRSANDVAVTAIVAALAWHIPRLIPDWMMSVPSLSFPVLAGSALVRLVSIILLSVLLLRAHPGSGGAVLAPFWACLFAFLVTDAIIRLHRHGNDGFGLLHGSSDQHRPSAPYVTLAAIVFSGLVIAATLANTRVNLVHAAGLIALAAGAVIAAGTWFLLRVTYFESREDETVAALSSSTEEAPLPVAITGSGGRRLIAFQSMVTVSALADPFMIVYAIERLRIPAQFAGIYAILFAIAAAATALTVPQTARRMASRKVLQIAALVRFLVPLVALTMALFGDTSAIKDAMAHNAGSAWLFGVTFLVLGVGRGLLAAGLPPYADGLLPEGTLQRVAQLSAIAVTVACLAPLLGAWAIDQRGLQAMLLLAAAAGFVALLISGSLAKSRTIGVRRRVRGMD